MILLVYLVLLKQGSLYTLNGNNHLFALVSRIDILDIDIGDLADVGVGGVVLVVVGPGLGAGGLLALLKLLLFMQQSQSYQGTRVSPGN